MRNYDNWSYGEHLSAARGALAMADEVLANVHASDSEIVMATGLAGSAQAHAALAEAMLIGSRLEQLVYPPVKVYGAGGNGYGVAGGDGGHGGNGSAQEAGARVTVSGAADSGSGKGEPKPTKAQPAKAAARSGRPRSNRG